MWDMYPNRFIPLLENLITDGMSEEQRAEWEAEMRVVDPTASSEADPMLLDLVESGQAANLADAAEMIRIADQISRADPDKAAALSKRMAAITARAIEAKAAQSA